MGSDERSRLGTVDFYSGKLKMDNSTFKQLSAEKEEQDATVSRGQQLNSQRFVFAIFTEILFPLQEKVHSIFALTDVKFAYDVAYDLKGFEPANITCVVTLSEVKNEIEFTDAANELSARLIFLGVDIGDVTFSRESSVTQLLKKKVGNWAFELIHDRYDIHYEFFFLL